MESQNLGNYPRPGPEAAERQKIVKERAAHECGAEQCRIGCEVSWDE